MAGMWETPARVDGAYVMWAAGCHLAEATIHAKRIGNPGCRKTCTVECSNTRARKAVALVLAAIIGYRHVGPDIAILVTVPRAWVRMFVTALVAAALAICERTKLHTAAMLLTDALNVLNEGDDELAR